MSSKAGPAFLSRISREFSHANAVSGPCPVEFSPIEFEEYIGNIQPSFSHSADNEDSQFDLNPPWDADEVEEGEITHRAHDKDEENRSYGRQYQQNAEGKRIMPHEAMTSILSAAEYTSKMKDHYQRQHGLQYQQQQKMQQQQGQPFDTQKYKQSLRLRAAKCMRANPGPATSCAASGQKNDNLKSKDRNMHDERTDTDDKEADRITYATNIRLVSPSPTPKIRTTNAPPYNPAKRSQSSQNKPSLAFFPRTSVTSPPNHSSRNSPTFSIKSSQTTHTDARTEVTTAMTTLSHYSDPPLSTSGMSRYSDPSLYYEDVQSQVSTSATSVSYGSDLENAARRILGRKRGLVHGDASSVGQVELVPQHVIGNHASLTGATHFNRRKDGVIQRRPSRERLRKKTGRRIGLPTRENTDDETDREEETAGEEMDVLHPLPPSRNLLGVYNAENNLDSDDEYESGLDASHVCQRNQLSISDEDEEEESKQPDKTRAYPTFPRPDPVKQVCDYDSIHEQHTMLNNYFAKELNCLPPTSWGDPNEAFFVVGDNINDTDDYSNFYDEKNAVNFDPKNNANYKMSDSAPMQSVWDDRWYQTLNLTRASYASSLEGDAGEAGESENDCGEFDEHDYFHDFGMKAGQSWEVLPAPLQFSPSRGVIGGNAGCDDQEFESSQMTKDYVKSASEIDFFAWNDDEYPAGRESAVFGDRQQSENIFQDQGLHSLQHRTNISNISTDVLPDPNAPRKRSASCERRKESNTNETLPASHEYPFSDGDTPTRKAKRGFNLFRSRNWPDGSLKYHSEGERFDSDVENFPDNNSFGLSPRRSMRRNAKQKVSQWSLSFYGDRHRHLHKKTEKESAPLMEYESLRKDEFSNGSALIALQTGLMHISPDRAKVMSIMNSSAVATQSKSKQITPDPVQVKSEINLTSEVIHIRNGCKVDEYSANVNSKPAMQKESMSEIEGSSLRSNSANKQGGIHFFASNRSNTPVTNLNDSLLTEETPLVSNKTCLNQLPQSPSLHQISSSLSAGRNANSSSPLSGLPPRVPASNPLQKMSSPVKRKQPRSPVFKVADVIISNENVDDGSISTLQSDSLGSLVTKATAEKSRRSDTSLRSGVSEIERLRKENERLREELENRSDVSSRVSSTYVKALKEENEHLRKELINASHVYNAPPNSSDIMYKSTIARLLERDEPKHHSRPRRVNTSDSPRKKQQHLNHRKPSAPLMNGAGFDDESITTQSESIRDKRFQCTSDANCRGGPGLLQKIATVADQVKSSTLDRNNLARERRTCEVSLSKPLELITACTRKDKTVGETTPCVTTVNSGKEVIERVLGCMKQNREGDKTATLEIVKADSYQSTKGDSASDSLVHRTVVKGTSSRGAALALP